MYKVYNSADTFFKMRKVGKVKRYKNKKVSVRPARPYFFHEKSMDSMISDILSGGVVHFSYAEKLCFADVFGKSQGNHTKM